MPTFGLTFFIRPLDRSTGWTETYYSNLYADYLACVTPALALANARAAIMPESMEIAEIRLSVPGSPRDSYVPSTAAIPGAVLLLVSPAAEYWSALLVRKDTDGTRTGHFFLRGIPELLLLPDYDYDPAGPLDPAFQTWAALVISSWELMKCKVATVTTFKTITRLMPMGLVERRVGRPFGLRVGRRMTH